MTKLFAPVLAVAFAVMLSGTAMAGNTANQTVGFEVSPIAELSVSGNPGLLNVHTATAGEQPDPATDTSTTYAVTSNLSRARILASLDANMPPHVELDLHLDGAGVGLSFGWTPLSEFGQTVLWDIEPVASGGHEIDYRLLAAADASVIFDGSRTVTLTLVNEFE